MAGHKLKIIAINVNSIFSNQRRDVLADFLIEHEPDILLLSETKLQPKCRLSFNKYSFVRNDRASNALRPNGGTGILIKTHFEFQHVKIPALNNHSFFETTIIKVKLASQKSLFVISVYGCTSDSPQFLDEFQNLFNSLDLINVNHLYILAGDFNAKHRSWLNPVNNSRGITIHRWIEDYGMLNRSQLYHTSLPTYERGSSFLDIAIADARINFQITVFSTESPNHDEFGLLLQQYDGDHGAIQMTVQLDEEDAFVMCQHVGRLQYKSVDWEKFSTNLYFNINRLRPTPRSKIIPSDRNIGNEEIDHYEKLLQTSLNETIDRTVKRSKQTTSSDKYTNWRIKLLKKRKNQILQALFEAKKHPHLTTQDQILRLKFDLQHLQILIKESFRKSVDSYWQSVLANLSPQKSSEMLPTINRICRPKNVQEIHPLVLPPVDRHIIDELEITQDQIEISPTGEVIVLDQMSMLRVIGKKFAAINIQNRNLGSPEHDRQIREELNNFIGHTELQPLAHFSPEYPAEDPTDVRFTTTEEVHRLCRNTNSKTSTGIDKIPNIVIKHIPKFLTREYAVLFNQCINNGYFPTSWKTGRVFPILKKNKNPAQPLSYRPITLLPNISKVFEKVIHRQMTEHAEEHQLLPNGQFGFRRGHSTVHAVTKLLSDICWQKNDRQGVGACLIDTEKAFDTVWLDGLIVKMIRIQFPAHIIQVLKIMLYEKKFCISSGEINTNAEFNILDGLQQGTVLAPLLFAVYTKDLLEDMVFQQPGKGIIAYADDLIVYSSGKRVRTISEDVQQLVHTVSNYFTKWKQRINPSKCETILFRAPLRHGPADFVRRWKHFQINVQNQPIQPSTSVTYLGVHLLNSGIFNQHCRNQLAKARRAFFSLRKIFFSRFIATKVKVICYMSMLRPIITYACPAWYNIDPFVMEEIRRFERRCLRCCLTIGSRSAESDFKKFHSNQVVYDAIDIPRIDNHIIHLTRNHIARLMSIPNPMVAFSTSSISNVYIQQCMQTGFIPPEAFLYLDANGYIQGRNGIPIIYHIIREHPKASIQYQVTENAPTAYETSIPPCDVPKTDIYPPQYWWLH